MKAEWKEYAVRVKDVLGLKGSPVAITYSLDPPSGAAAGKFRVCDAFIQARDGKIIDLTVSTSACGGGSWHLGLCPQPTGQAARQLKDFLVNGESSSAPSVRSRGYSR